VTDAFLSTHKIDKGLMTLVDEERQFHLLSALSSHSFHVKRSCCGSACNSIVAASQPSTSANAPMGRQVRRFWWRNDQTNQYPGQVHQRTI